MKRIIRLIPLLSILCLISCDPGEWMTDNEGYWYIKNMTDKSITVKCIVSEYNTRTNEIAPEDSLGLLLYGIPIAKKELPTFDDFFTYYDHVPVQVFSDDGELLKEWNWSDAEASDLPEFFDESYWRKYTQKKSGKETRISWIFDFYQ